MWRVARIPKNAGIVTPPAPDALEGGAADESLRRVEHLLRADDERDFDVAGLDGLNGVSKASLPVAQALTIWVAGFSKRPVACATEAPKTLRSRCPASRTRSSQYQRSS